MNEIVERWFGEIVANSGELTEKERLRLESQIAGLERNKPLLENEEVLRARIQQIKAEIAALESEYSAIALALSDAESALHKRREEVATALIEECETFLRHNQAACEIEMRNLAYAWKPLRDEAMQVFGAPLEDLQVAQLRSLLGESMAANAARLLVRNRLSEAVQARNAQQDLIDKVSRLHKQVEAGEGELARIKKLLITEHGLDTEVLNQMLGVNAPGVFLDFLRERIVDAGVEANWKTMRDVFQGVGN